MPNCKGNDFIMTIAIDQYEMAFMLIHEKDTTCNDIQQPELTGTACIFNTENKSLEYGYIYNMKNHELYPQVDNKSLIYSPSITQDFYRIYKMPEHQRNKQDNTILEMFWLYLELVLKSKVDCYEALTPSLITTLHWIITVPDKWGSAFTTQFKHQLLLNTVFDMDNVIIIPQSEALISYIQLPHYNYGLVNGEYLIVCLLREHDQVILNEYEIGVPVKGLNKVSNYTLKKSQTFKIRYLKKDYLIKEIFEFNKDDQKKYNVNCEDIIQLCYDSYWNTAAYPTLYDLLMEYKDVYLKDIDPAFYEDKEEQLRSITWDSVYMNKGLQKSSFKKVNRIISEVSKVRYNVKVIASSEANLVRQYELPEYFDQLPSDVTQLFNNFSVVSHIVFIVGAAHRVQNQVELLGKVPEVVYPEKLDAIKSGNNLYINIKWDCNSFVYVDSKKNSTYIKNISEVIENCYTVRDCFNIKEHDNQYRVPEINTTDRFIQFFRLDELLIWSQVECAEENIQSDAENRQSETQQVLLEADEELSKTKKEKLTGDEEQIETIEVGLETGKIQLETKELESDREKIESEAEENYSSDESIHFNTKEKAQEVKKISLEGEDISVKSLDMKEKPEENKNNLLVVEKTLTNNNEDQLDINTAKLGVVNTDIMKKPLHLKEIATSITKILSLKNAISLKNKESTGGNSKKPLDTNKITYPHEETNNGSADEPSSAIPSLKEQLQSITSFFFPDPTELLNYKTTVTTENCMSLLTAYIDTLQVYIRDYLIETAKHQGSEKINYYLSVDSFIIERFLQNYDTMRHIFLFELPAPYAALPMKLIYPEQVTGVHCKDTIQWYNIAQEIVDYPQHLLQVQLDENYIDFAANVILPLDQNNISAENETLLTLKSRRIELNMVEMIGEALWDHIQSMGMCPITTCSTHRISDYQDDIDMYHAFVESFSHYFIEEYMMGNEQGLSSFYKTVKIKMNKNCACTFDIAPIDIFDICINPAIEHLTSVIYSTTTNSHIFGSHNITHIAIMGAPINLKCLDTCNEIMKRLKNRITQQRRYYSHITLHWIPESILSIMHKGILSISNNPKGGLLEQITSGLYYITFSQEGFYLEGNEMLSDRSCIYFSDDTRITDSFRNEGCLKTFFFKDDNLRLGSYKY
ncbi:hypothetical protein BDB01DRAFT_811086 [Pilobolus umbonatus]|nr:hypothetical protein BDB01DRAFT_811086 [Pilobolus umbonatus]